MLIVEGMAQVRAKKMGLAGLYENEWSGVLTRHNLPRLVQRTAYAMRDARAILVRSEGAIVTFEELPDVLPEMECLRGCAVPIAMLVRPAHYQAGRAVTARLLRAGVMQTCWLQEQREQAMDWLSGCLHLHGQSIPV